LKRYQYSDSRSQTNRGKQAELTYLKKLSTAVYYSLDVNGGDIPPSEQHRIEY